MSDLVLNATRCFDIAAANKRCLFSNKQLSSWLSKIAWTAFLIIKSYEVLEIKYWLILCYFALLSVINENIVRT